MKPTQLARRMVAVAFLVAPLAATAQEAAIEPAQIDFGEVCVGAAVTESLTVTSAIDDDLRIFAIAFLEGDNPAGAYSVEVLDPYGDPMPQGSFVTVEVSYEPAEVALHPAELTVVTNDGATPIQTVPLTGAGVACDPTTENLETLLADIDSGAIDLHGVGPGASAEGRYGAFLHMLEAAIEWIEAGLVDEACGQLESALRRVDGERPPPDFVDGDGAAEAYDDIAAAMSALGCR